MKWIAILPLVLTGCAAPVAWMKADGVATPEQRQLAMSICQGEVQKDTIDARQHVGIITGIQTREDIYAGCMAQHGFVSIPLR